MPSAAPPGIGTKLRKARIERSLSIQETAWRTRIRPDLLRALEREQFDRIGHQEFIRTHLSSYARFLGIDPAEVVDEYSSTQEDLPEPILELERKAVEAKKPPRAKWFIAAMISAGVFAIAALVGVLGGQTERPTGTTAPLASGLASPGVAAAGTVALGVQVLQPTTVSVFTDGSHVFDAQLARGASKMFHAHSEIEIVVADGGTISLDLNGKHIGPAGTHGNVYHARFGPNGPLQN